MHKDDAGYYIILAGIRLNWNAEDKLFYPEEGSMPEEALYDEEGNRRGFSTEMVNLNGFNLDDPNAKPKVQVNAQGRYYVVFDGNTYYWYAPYKAFFCGDPTNYEGKPLEANEVDLNGYTLP